MIVGGIFWGMVTLGILITLFGPQIIAYLLS